jgi:hypothetical protein
MKLSNNVWWRKKRVQWCRNRNSRQVKEFNPINSVANAKHSSLLRPSTGPFYLHFLLRVTKCSYVWNFPTKKKFRTYCILTRNKGRKARRQDEKTGETQRIDDTQNVWHPLFAGHGTAQLHITVHLRDYRV